MSATIKAANGVNDYLKDIFTNVIKVNWIQIHRWSISKVISFQKIWEWIKKLFLIPVDSYTYIVDHLKLLLCDSLIRPISIGLIFLCGNESTFHLISAEISATPKSARLKFEQPLNCGFVTGLQKPYKPLCGRRCRPLWTAEGKQRNPSAFTCLFSYRLPISAKGCENRSKRLFAFAGLVFTRCGVASRHTGRHSGLRTGLWRQYQCRSFTLTLLTSVCSVLGSFGFLGFGTAEEETVPDFMSIKSRTPAGTVLV